MSLSLSLSLSLSGKKNHVDQLKNRFISNEILKGFEDKILCKYESSNTLMVVLWQSIFAFQKETK